MLYLNLSRQTRLLAGLLLSGCAAQGPSGWYVDAPRTQIRVQASGMRINGQPFFPFGFYHVSWADQGTPKQRLDDLVTIARGGFNTVMTEPIASQAELPVLLQLARREKLYVLAHNITPGEARQLTAQPALLGFTLMDDSNDNSSPQAIAKLQATYKALAPDKLTAITLSLAENRPENGFFGVSDAVSNLSYPIGTNDELGVVYGVMRQTVTQAEARGVIPLASLQTFAWPGKRYPTAAELRNMTYQAVMAGVKGVSYYSFRSGGNRLTDHPALWSAAQAMALQLRVLAPSLLEGKRREWTQANNSLIKAVSFSGPRSAYLLVLNTSPRPQLVQLKVPLSKASALFERATLRLSGGRLSGTLAGLGVQVLRVE